jgi:starch-binding outer membrane protein, SusD/RagB family
MKKIIQSIVYSGLAVLLLQTGGCKKDYTNPNAATSEQVYSSAKGLAGIAVGLQKTYASNVSYGMSDATGLLTGETILLNAGNGSELQFVTGGNAVDGTNALLGNLWSATNKVIYDANNVINAAALLSDKNYASGLIGYATIFKALSMGCQAGYWEKVPDTVGTATSTFSDRMVGYNRAIAAIDKALSTISANAISAAFLTDIPAGTDIVNTLQAVKARYALFAGNYAQALAAANAVDLTKKSTLNFEAANPNPVYNSVTSTNNVYQPVDSTFGLPIDIRPALTDKRVPFYTLINTTINPRFRLNGFWIVATTPIPLYIPDEMRLIRAECYVRQTTPNLASAKADIDAILMQTPAQDPFGVGADIAGGYTGTVDAPSLLTEIYRNRCIELYLSGMKLEDMRRFGRPLTERKRNLLPYPFRERDGNSNTPPDPAF